MNTGAGEFTAEQQSFFEFFNIKVPPGVSREGAQRFMQAFLRDPARLTRWRDYCASRIAKPSHPPAAAVAPQPLAMAAHARYERLSFTGSGGEYFRIWIVNVTLTVLTLGIYSAWAKVRRLQYFYRHTQLAGASFDYDGSPIAILKGRLIAVGLLLAYNLSFEASLSAGIATLCLLAIALPWLLRNSFRFRLRYSSYRGVRFRFGGRVVEAYWTLLVLPVITVLTAYLAAPWFHQRLKQYQHGNSFLGQTGFSFDAGVGRFYKTYLLLAALLIGAAAGFGILIGTTVGPLMAAMAKGGGSPVDPRALMGTLIAATLFLFGALLLITPIWQAKIQNLVWSHTAVGPHRFRSELSIWKLAGIHITNFIGVVLTFGLFMPWAAVRSARCRVEAVNLDTAGSLDDILSQPEDAHTAVGEETAELFDVDIGL